MRRRGLTMLELLLALALMATLLVAMFAFLRELGAARADLVAAAARDRAIGDLFDAVERDLATAVGSDARFGAGVRGGAETLEILQRGVDLGAAARGVGAAAALGDLQRTAYRFVPGAGRIEQRRGEGAAWSALAEGVGRVRFRYHDGDGWRDRFESAGERGLPRLVEIAVWHRAPDDDADADGGAAAAPDDASADDEAMDAALADDPFAADPAAETPPPDRIRVIAVPDAAAGGDADAEAGA